jgi:hypothetical protein
VVSITLRYDLDTPVGHVARTADEPELERPAPGPPAETDPLDPPADPRRQPGVRLFLTHAFILSGLFDCAQ